MEKNEMTVDLKGLVISAFRNSKKILVVAIVFGLLLGGLMAVKTYKAYNSEEGLQNLKNEHEEKRIEYAHQKEQAERTVAVLTPTIEQKQDYLDRSVSMRMNPYQIYAASVTYLVNTDYQIMPDKVYQNKDFTDTVGVSYVAVLQSGELMEKMATAIDTEACYMNEVISVSYQSGMVNVRLTCDSQQNLNTLLKMVNDEINGNHDRIQTSVVEHSITKTNESTYTTTNPGLATTQQSEMGNLQEMQEKVEEAQHDLDVLLLSKEPEWVEYSTTLLIKKFIKFGIVGCVVGAILVMCTSVCGYLFGTKVYSGYELKERLFVVLLGNIPEKVKNHKGHTSLINKLEKRPQLSVDVETALAGANIANYAGDARKVLLTGDVEDKKLENLQKSLSSKKYAFALTASGDMFKNPATVESIKDFDAVVLVAETGVSTYENVKKQLNRMKELKIKVLGCIVID